MVPFTPIKISGIDPRQTQPIREGSDRFKFVFNLKAENDRIPEKWIELFDDGYGGQPELHWANVQSKSIVVSGYGYTGVSEDEIAEVFEKLKEAVRVVNGLFQRYLDDEEAKRNAKRAVIGRLQASLNFD